VFKAFASMIISIFFLTFFYLVILLWLRLGLQHVEKMPKSPNHDFPTVALIVCARNEEQRLPRLLQALAQQIYPADKLEICLVDDRSTDRTGELIAAFAAAHENVIPLRIENTLPNFAPKKRAIDTAIRRTTGEIILLTDADAEPGPLWIQEMARAFTPETVMVCGYSPYWPRATFWQKILALEYFSHPAVAAGGAGQGRPLTCTGSNLAYRRDAYFRIGGFDGIAHWISGDDDLLLHKMRAVRVGKIQYAAHPATHTPVRPPNSWREFQSQRTRYASKSLHYEPLLTLSLALFFLLNLLIGAGLFSILIAGWNFFISTLLVISVKAIGEFFYLRRAAKIFGEKKISAVFPLAALLHPFYVIYFAARGQFARFYWRGEKFAARQNPVAQHSCCVFPC
jgi:cellulose synthase/poly-beta-1,6-N-acetylglucosamine synthase-like glycosyltransferase